MLQLTDRTAEVRCQDSVRTITSSAQRRRVILSGEERLGLRHILDNPKAPTQALKNAVASYKQSTKSL